MRKTLIVAVRIIPLLHVEQITRQTWQERYPRGTLQRVWTKIKLWKSDGSKRLWIRLTRLAM